MYGNIARRMLNAMTFVTDDIRAYIAGYTIVVLLISLSSAFFKQSESGVDFIIGTTFYYITVIAIALAVRHVVIRFK